MAKVYLDYAATTPLAKEVAKAMAPYLKQGFGNASSLHQWGRKAREAVETSRQQLSEFLNCSLTEVFFTGSATEADNLAIFGVIRATLRQAQGKLQNFKPHIIISSIEHPAVLEPVKHLEKAGEIEATYLPVGKEGIVKVADLEKAIKPPIRKPSVSNGAGNTVLVSIMYANNEIGTIQPIAEIGKIIHQSPIANHQSPVIFHCDAVQAANYLDCDVQKLGCDLLTLSAHKIYGPKGVGVLYVKKGTPVEPIIFGGHQENGLRPGTENVAGIVGFGAAAAAISNLKSQIANIAKLRDKLSNGILKNIPGTALNGSRENRLPNNANISFQGVEGESILMALDQKGIAVSTGSACASGSLEPSHVLMALHNSPIKAHGSIRFTLGRYTTASEIDYVLKVLPEVIEKLRKISPIK